jgi:hypothetical protein
MSSSYCESPYVYVLGIYISKECCPHVRTEERERRKIFNGKGKSTANVSGSVPIYKVPCEDEAAAGSNCRRMSNIFSKRNVVIFTI